MINKTSVYNGFQISKKLTQAAGLGQLQYSQIIKRNLDLIKFDNVDREPNQTNFLSPSLKFQNRTDYNDQPVSKMVSES